MNKAEAEREALKQWQALPIANRSTLDDALTFAKTLDAVLDFETLGSKPRILEAWLIRALNDPIARSVVTAPKRPAPITPDRVPNPEEVVSLRRLREAYPIPADTGRAGHFRSVPGAFGTTPVLPPMGATRSSIRK